MDQKSYFYNSIGTAGLKMSTAECYWGHVDQFIQYCAREFKTDRPSSLGIDEVKKFIEFLYVTKHLSAKSRNQALAAIRFLYDKVIGKPLDEEKYQSLRAKQGNYARRVLISKPDMAKLFSAIPRPYRLIFQLMYAGAMRLSDVIQLRVKDINFDQQLICICDCKHDHFRSVPFPKSLHDAVRKQIESVRVIHSHDSEDNPNGVPLPDARRRKAPNDARALAWYWLFPSSVLSRDKQTGFFGRYHLDDDNCRKVFRSALFATRIDRRITPHDLRRTAATRMHFEMGMPLVRLQKILAHKSLDQTREYILEDEIAINGSMSPFDGLPSVD